MATIIGTPGGETLNGTGQDDTILALGGSDVIQAGAGNDVIIAGPGGSDTISGGAGIDTLILNGTFVSYSVSFANGSFVFAANGVTETVDGVEFVAFDDQVVRLVGAGSEPGSLQASIAAASTAETLIVAPGDYSAEGIIDVVNKTIEVRGALAGSSPIADAAAWSNSPHTIIDSFLTVGTGGVVLDGVDLRGLTGSAGDPAAGVKVLGTGGVTVLNSVISAIQFSNTAVGIELSSVSGDLKVDNVLFEGFTIDASTSGTFSAYGIYFNTDASVDRDISVTNSTFDLREGGDAGLRSYGIAFDGYGLGTGTLDISDNTFNDMTWGMLFWDSAGTVIGTPDYTGIEDNVFTDTNEAVGNIRNLTNHVIVTGSNTSNGTLYADFRVGSANADIIVGTAGDNLIAGNDGADVITGGGATTRSTAEPATTPPTSTSRPTGPTRSTSARATTSSTSRAQARSG